MAEKDPIASIFLAIFLGWCGLDRIFSGHYISGVLKMATFGGFGTWWLIDIFSLLIVEDYFF